ncbi:MAG: cation:proton antiporter [Alphaproteobacteria bacterium]
MPHETSLIALMAIGLVFAFAFGFVASKLRLPPLVGYLLAGIAMGPFTPGFVGDVHLALELAEIGVILLMFGVGLHFSAADLRAVRSVAVPGGILQILVATAIGAALAMSWGWSLGAGIVLGLSLSVASTVVLLRALDDRNSIETVNGRVAVGWLIVEDLAMVLALVLLPAFAEIMGGSKAAGASDGSLLVSLAATLGKVVAFVVLALTIGPRIVPWLLSQVARSGSRELFTLSVLAVALGIAFGSAKLFGVSFALGAFFAGVILSESDLSHKAAEDSLPLQDAFAVLFFVSVGMLFDPSILVREPWAVAAVLAVILFGKSLAAFVIVIGLGYPATTAITVSAALAQIGEFTFILAGLGLTLGILPPEGRDLLLAGGILSITFNPLMFWAAERLSGRLRPRAGSRRDLRLSALRGELDRTQHEKEAKQGAYHGLRTGDLARKLTMFEGLDGAEREELLTLFRPRAALPGERIIRKGDRADAAFFISSGSVEVDVEGGESVRLGPGEFFGEMALLSGMRRSADVTAIDYSQLLALNQREFRRFLTKYPSLRARIDEVAAQRTEMNKRRRETPAAS